MEEIEDERVTPAQRAFRRRLGVTIGRVRKRLTEYTQETIAEALGVDTETVGRWERGQREPTAYKLALMAEKYRLPDEVAAWFLYPTDSISEIDERIERIRQLQQQRAAEEAARAQVAAEARRADARGAARRGRR